MDNNIAVLITCHNRAIKTINCLKALYAQQFAETSIPFDAYLVDDGSTDNTSQLVKENFPEVKIVYGDGSLFWNRGMHLAWSEAAKKKYAYYVWLNDDTILYADAFADLLHCAKITNRNAIICGTTQSAKTGAVTYGGRLVRGGLISPNGNIQPCDYFNGNCVLIPKKVFEAIGNLDPVFNHAIGDWDYGLRARKKGFLIYVSTDFVGTCEKHESISKWCSPDIPLKERMIAFKSPLAVNPQQYFKFDSRHNGYFKASVHFISIHLRLLFPKLWTIKKSHLG